METRSYLTAATLDPETDQIPRDDQAKEKEQDQVYLKKKEDSLGIAADGGRFGYRTVGCEGRPYGGDGQTEGELAADGEAPTPRGKPGHQHIYERRARRRLKRVAHRRPARRLWAAVTVQIAIILSRV
jgi:hypothetical protein